MGKVMDKETSLVAGQPKPTGGRRSVGGGEVLVDGGASFCFVLGRCIQFICQRVGENELI